VKNFYANVYIDMKSALHTIKRKNAQGFTLIELLVVIGILAVLLAIVLVAINPAEQFAKANNTQRKSDVTAVLNAIGSYMADNNGDLPTGKAGATVTNLKTGCSAAACDLSSTDGAGKIDLCAKLAPTYIAALPHDPKDGTGTDCTTYDTAYSVQVSATGNRVTVCAPSTDTAQDPSTPDEICVTR
jgi:type IV pilus assembly protein PilA